MKLFRTKFRKYKVSASCNFIEYKKWYQRKWHTLKDFRGRIYFYGYYYADDVIEALERAKF